MSGETTRGHVVAVARDGAHRFAKQCVPEITLMAGLGVAGDAHAGTTVQHLSRVAKDPSQPNLRQVHLIHAELFDEVAALGFAGIKPAMLGENVTVGGIALLDLPAGTRLRLGADAIVAVTGLRNPCGQIDRFRPGLMAATLDRAADGSLIRKAGVMAVVIAGGQVRPGDAIEVTLPDPPFVPLGPI